MSLKNIYISKIPIHKITRLASWKQNKNILFMPKYFALYFIYMRAFFKICVSEVGYVFTR